MKNIVYFDLETQKSAAEVGGWGHIDRMGISVAVLYHSAKGEYEIYLEKDVDRLAIHLGQRPCQPQGVVTTFCPVGRIIEDE